MSFLGFHFGNNYTRKRGVPAVIFLPEELIMPVKHILQQEERFPTMSDLVTGYALIALYLKKTPETDSTIKGKTAYAGHAFETFASKLHNYLKPDGRFCIRKSRWDELVSYMPVVQSSTAAYKKTYQPEEREGVAELAAFRAASKMPLMGRSNADAAAVTIRNLEAFVPAFKKLNELVNPLKLPAPPTHPALFWHA